MRLAALRLAAAFAVSRLLVTQLYSISPRDPAMFGVAATANSLIVLASSYLTALRASLVESSAALRSD
jgi:hypothetical protein